MTLKILASIFMKIDHGDHNLWEAAWRTSLRVFMCSDMEAETDMANLQNWM